MQIHISPNPDGLSIAAADWMVEYINKTLQQQQTFSFVLSGGSTPKKLYTILSGGEYKNKIDWQRIHIFFGDERFVPFDDERNNAKMAFDTLLSYVAVKKENIHIIQTENIRAEESAMRYENEIRNYFLQSSNPNKNQSQTSNFKPQTSFDLVLLGMGDDGHTLSLFPGQTAIIFEKEKCCVSLWLPSQKMYRITLTAPVVNGAKAIAFLVSGKIKSAALHAVLNGEKNISLYPSQIINPLNGQLHWFVDNDAMKK